jgi:hypothetical protein
MKDLEKLPADRQCQEEKTTTDDLVNTPKHTVWKKEKPIPYISNDKFSQEVIFHYWLGVCQGTLMLTKHTRMSSGCGDSTMVSLDLEVK